MKPPISPSAKGWRTWDTRSLLHHILLPQGVGIRMGIYEFQDGQFLQEAFVGLRSQGAATVRPIDHARDGSYTHLALTWKGIEAEVQTAAEGENWVCLFSPKKNQLKPATLVVSATAPWNLGGWAKPSATGFDLCWSKGTIAVRVEGPKADSDMSAWYGPTLGASLTQDIWIIAGHLTKEQAQALLDRKKREHHQWLDSFGQAREIVAGMQGVLTWDTIYDARERRVISPVSRIWNTGHGGWVLFCWDAFFAAWMASTFDTGLAEDNATAILSEVTSNGFVPNCAYATGVRSSDRSQPPVGSLACMAIFAASKNRSFLERVYPQLLEWNRWWPTHRDVGTGLAWGSDPYPPIADNYWERHGVGERLGASLESGLDNSPMYDDIPFDAERHTLKLADAGLTGLYAADCEALAELAETLGRSEEAKELRSRQQLYNQKLKELWNDEMGMFCNRRTDTGQFETRLSPTNFYPLIAKVATPEQAERMAHDHLTNPAEFWGEFTIPSISRSDPAFKDNNYWRGRIWAPMNFLVYLGLCRYPSLNKVREEFAQKSVDLFLKEWLEEGHVHENYNADTGDGDDVSSSDAYYHWGALLALIGVMEKGLAPKPLP